MKNLLIIAVLLAAGAAGATDCEHLLTDGTGWVLGLDTSNQARAWIKCVGVVDPDQGRGALYTPPAPQAQPIVIVMAPQAAPAVRYAPVAIPDPTAPPAVDFSMMLPPDPHRIDPVVLELQRLRSQLFLTNPPMLTAP